MRKIVCLVLLVALIARAATTPSNLEAVNGARMLLGRDVWSLVLEIENTGATSLYPKTTYALVFEFNDMLWFYTPHDGTQSLTLYANQLEHDKTHLQPMLTEIHRGFSSFRELPESAADSAAAVLPNGCFIESVVAARELFATGQRVFRAGVLLYYAKGQTRQGHAVLAYETEAGVFIDDSERARPEKVKGKWSERPLEIARRHEPGLRRALVTAKLVPIRVDASSTRALASIDRSGAEPKAG
ncbi:MAG: hypothetical protein KBA71_08630 [Opitutaceae bacterium]|nr:hypothetical protein [Opitutaceae bacterium]